MPEGYQALDFATMQGKKQKEKTAKKRFAK